MKKLYHLAAVTAAMFSLTGCLGDGDETIILEEQITTDIPGDNKATPAPEIPGTNATIPNVQVSTVDENGNAVVRIDMTGIQNKNNLEWLRLYGTGEKNQNVWVTVDGTPKGVKVYNTADDGTQHTSPVDLTFLVDNSGSMYEEADVIARDIKSWANLLAQSGLDVRFGVVGYDGAITGAFPHDTAEKLSEYLDRYTGTSRTMGFLNDSKSQSLMQYTENYRTGGNSAGECGMAALRFADEHFSFRTGANRIYVNFTDEPNQPCGKPIFSVESLKDNWETWQGTIHTVFSGGKEYSNEYNYLMSQYTGGTVLNTNSSFAGISLTDLPVSDAMLNSYILRITNIKSLMDGKPHEVTITIYAADGQVAAERTFMVIFEMAE